MKRLFLRLRRKGPRYWATALVIVFLASTASPYVYDYLQLKERRAYVLQRLLEWGPRPPRPNFLSLVLIGDQEYWQGEFAGRRPIKRDYLAKIVDKLVSANVHLIALDFDVRLPNPRSMEIPVDYQKETDVLIDAILRAATQGKKVVLATPISFDEEGRYRQDYDIYQPYGLCKRTREDGSAMSVRAREVGDAIKNISCGYIALPYDPLVVPGALVMADGGYLDSFALAIARALRPELVSNLLQRAGNSARYTSYISDDMFVDFKLVHSARDLLKGDADRERLEARAVVVGGDWHSLATDRGPRVDAHWTPVGLIVGATLHANFAEALLDSRIFGAPPDWILHATEIAFSLIAAIAFALIRSVWGKLVGFVSLGLLLLVIQWGALHGFGVFFDAFVPLLGLALHSLYERLVGSHDVKVEAKRR